MVKIQIVKLKLTRMIKLQLSFLSIKSKSHTITILSVENSVNLLFNLRQNSLVLNMRPLSSRQGPWKIWLVRRALHSKITLELRCVSNFCHRSDSLVLCYIVAFRFLKFKEMFFIKLGSLSKNSIVKKVNWLTILYKIWKCDEVNR